MERFKNGHGTDSSVSLDSLFSSNLFRPAHGHEEYEGFALHTNLGSITVVGRPTGFKGYIHYIETGFMDKEGRIWIASGMQDIRDSGVKTFGEAIRWIKERANTCVPEIQS